MTQLGVAGRNRLPSGFPALVTVFLLIVGFTFSDDLVEYLLDVTGNSRTAATGRQWLVLAVDLVLVLVTAALKWRISERRTGPATFLRTLVTGWWGLGAVLVLGAHLALILTSEHRAGLGDLASFWISVLATAIFVAAMTLLLLSALSENPGSRGWIAPLVIGTFVAQLASALWYPAINTEGACAGDVSSGFFSDVTNVLSLVLLSIAVELNYVRRSANETDPGRRIAPVFTVLLMCVALGLGFTMLVKADQQPRCGVGALWHEYIVFVVDVQALAIGLATMVWLLVADAVAPD